MHISLGGTHADEFVTTGGATGEEEDTEGARKEENHIHPPIRQCHYDWWEEEGTSPILIQSLRISVSDDDPHNAVGS